MKRRWAQVFLALLLALVAGIPAGSPSARGFAARTAEAADPAVNVLVTIEQVNERGGTQFDGGFFSSPPDFYAAVQIGDEVHVNKGSEEAKRFEDQAAIQPDWKFSTQTPIPLSRGSVPLVIEIWDEDGGLRADDEQADVSIQPGRSLVLTLNLDPCSVTPDLFIQGDGQCGVSNFLLGTETPFVGMTFRVEVVDPPSAPGLNVRCVHDPVRPAPGAPVTITATALGGDGVSLNSVGGGGRIEIWVNDKAGPAHTESNATATRAKYVAGGFSSPFAYGCRVVRADGTAVFTGWRRTWVGPFEALPALPFPVIGTASGFSAIPVIYTAPRSSALDIVLAADTDSYSGIDDPNFLEDVRKAIFTAYYGQHRNGPDGSDGPGGSAPGVDSSFNLPIFLANQDQLNFWISPYQASAGSRCSSTGISIPWADLNLILHRFSNDELRNCARPDLGIVNQLSTATNAARLIRHESGHIPFGLSDEYCCNSIYWQADPHPNVYTELDDCRADAPTLGRTPGTCREFTAVYGPDYALSEPANDDLMAEKGNYTPQAADLRRMSWVFEQCRSARC